MISECITNGIPFLYISDNNHLEQKVISEKLIKKGFSNRIIKKDLDNIVISKDSISKIKSKKENNAVDQVTDILKKILNDKFKKIELNE